MNDEISWYYVAEDEGGRRQEGPVSTGDVRAMLSGGQVTPDTFVWNEGLSEWARIGTLAEFAQFAPGEGAPPDVEQDVGEVPGAEHAQEAAEVGASPETVREAGPEPEVAGELQPAGVPDAPDEQPAEAPGELQDVVTIRETANHSIQYSRSRGLLLITTNDADAGALALRKLDVIDLLREMESASHGG